MCTVVTVLFMLLEKCDVRVYIYALCTGNALLQFD